MYSKLKCQVRTSSGESDMFPQSNGVMQGECLSPTLFTAYINEIERLMNDVDEIIIIRRIFIHTRSTQILITAVYT